MCCCYLSLRHARQIATRFLSALGYVSVVTAGNGREAVETVRASAPFSIVLMDCQMPVMDGFTATRLIRQFEEIESRAHVPIIAMTAYTMPEVRACSAAAVMTRSCLFKRLTLIERRQLSTHVASCTSTQDQEKCLSSGMDDYISKPFTQQRLQSLITACLPE